MQESHLLRIARLLAAGLVLSSLLGAGPAALGQGVVLNEIDYNPALGSRAEFVELRNAASFEIDVSSWQFTNGIRTTIPMNTRIPAGGFLVVAKDPEFLRAAYSIPSNLVGGFSSSLDNAGDRIELSDSSGTVIDSVRYDNRFPWPEEADGGGASLERVCASANSQAAGNWAADPVRGPTPGRANNLTRCPLPPYEAPPVVLNEIFYHPQSDHDSLEEYVEIANTTQGAIDISGWSFSDGIEFTFPAGTVLGKGGILVVAANAEYIRTTFGIQNVLGNFTGFLSNDGERVAIADSQGKEVDAVLYLDKGEWPVSADGTGRSLEKIDPLADSSDPASWTSAACSGFQEVDFTGAATSSRLYFYFEGQAEGIIDDLSLTSAANPAQEFLPGGDFGSQPTAGIWTFAGNHSNSRWQPTGGAGDSGCLRIVSDGTGGSSSNSVSRYTSPDLTVGTSYRLRFKLKVISGNAPLVARLSGSGSTSGIFVRPGCSALSPGAENLSRQDQIPPFIAHARHFPKDPKPADAVRITASVRGPSVSAVRLSYDAGTEKGEVPMADDGLHGDGVQGDGVYGAELPPYPHNTLVRFRIYADGAGQTTRLPPGGDPSVDLAYYVSNIQANSVLPVHHILINNLNSLGCSVYSTGTFVSGGEVYLNVGVRNRGMTACGQTKNHIKVRFNQGRYFQGKHKLNFNSLWSDKSLIREKLQWDLWRDENHPYCEAGHVRLYNNGVYHGLFIYIENPDKYFLERNGLDPDGNLYKANASTEQKQPNIAGYMSAYEKKTNEDGDYTDLATFVDQLNDTPEAGILAWLHQNVQIEAMLDYQTVAVAAGNVDHGHKNHYLYHEPTTGKWWPLIWDLDLSLGRTFVANNYGVYNDEIHPFDVGELYGVGWNSLLTRFYNVRSSFTPTGSGYFRRAYYGRLWTMLREKCTEERIGEQAELLRSLLDVEQALDFAKWGRYPSRPAPGSPAHPPDFDYNVDELLNIGAAAGKGFLDRHLDFLRGHLEALGFRGFPLVRITEIMYHPAEENEDLEFIELYNSEAKATIISNWYVTPLDFTIPTVTSLAAGEVVVIAKNPDAFRARYPSVRSKILGPYPGELPNSGGEIRIYEARPSQGPNYPAYYPLTIDFVRYGDASPWPELADGEGRSLEIADVSLDNDYPSSWQVSERLGGSPGYLGQPPAGFQRGDVDFSGTVDLTDAVRILDYLFLKGAVPDCLDAADSNDSGSVDISDTLNLLFYLFAGGGVPPDPSPGACGTDPTADPLPDCLRGC